MTELNTNTLDQFLSEHSNVVVDLWAQWCQPCKLMIPVLEQIVEDEVLNVTIAKVNVDEYKDIAVKYGVKGIPTLLFFKDGELVFKNTGLLNKGQIEEKIRETFNI